MSLPPSIMAVVFTCSLVLSALLVIPAAVLAARLGAVDRPGGRRKHDRPTPRMGGIAIMLSFLCALLGGLVLGAAGESGSSGIRPALLVGSGALALMILGAVDDVRPLPARLKLGIEAAVIVAVVSLVIGAPQVDLGVWRIPDWLWPLSFAFTTLWVLTITNAYNMIDGLDGLAGGVGAIAAGALAIQALLNGSPLAGIGLVGLSGALLGFLVHNRWPARVFMGDSGTLPVGFLLGTLAVLATTGVDGWTFLPAGIALGIPLADVTLAVVRRGLRSLSLVHGADALRERFRLSVSGPPGLFEPDSDHLHHRLVERGLDGVTAVRYLHVVGVALGAGAVVAALRPGIAPWIAGGLITGVAFLAVSHFYVELRVLQRGLLLPLFDLPIVTSRRTHAAFDLFGTAAAWGTTSFLLAGGAGPAEILRDGLLAGVVMVGLLWAGSLYRVSLRHVGAWQGTRMALLVCGAGMAIAGLLPLAVGTTGHAGGFVFLFGSLTTTLLVGTRLSFQVLDALYQRRDRTGRKVLIYGAGRCGMMALATILQDPLSNRVPVGFLDDDPVLAGRIVDGYPVLGGVESLRDILERTGAQEVIVTTRRLRDANRARLRTVCSANGHVQIDRWQGVFALSNGTDPLASVDAGAGGGNEPGESRDGSPNA